MYENYINVLQLFKTEINITQRGMRVKYYTNECATAIHVRIVHNNII